MLENNDLNTSQTLILRESKGAHTSHQSQIAIGQNAPEHVGKSGGQKDKPDQGRPEDEETKEDGFAAMNLRQAGRPFINRSYCDLQARY